MDTHLHSTLYSFVSALSFLDCDDSQRESCQAGDWCVDNQQNCLSANGSKERHPLSGADRAAYQIHPQAYRLFKSG